MRSPKHIQELLKHTGSKKPVLYERQVSDASDYLSRPRGHYKDPIITYPDGTTGNLNEPGPMDDDYNFDQTEGDGDKVT